MARLVLVTQGDEVEPPQVLDLLQPQRRKLSDPEWDQMLEADLVLLDARQDLARAKDACLRLNVSETRSPVLLLVEKAALGLLEASWGFTDFVLADADPAELHARIRLLLDDRPTTSVVNCGPVSIDESAYTASAGGRPLELTYTEFELLKYLVTNPERVLSRETLLSEVWGYDYYGGTRTVDVHIRRLRAKLSPEFDAHISTVRNVGYRFSAKR